MHHVMRKTKMINDYRFRPYRMRAQEIQDIAGHIETFNNRQRKQARLGRLSPAAFTQRYYKNLLAA
jgi:putative transposase